MAQSRRGLIGALDYLPSQKHDAECWRDATPLLVKPEIISNLWSNCSISVRLVGPDTLEH